MNLLSEAALEYAGLGWQIHPLHTITPEGGCSCGAPDCSSPGKHPYLKRWPSEATTDPAAITTWWETHPEANVGIATGRASGIVVLDVDVGPEKDGPLSLERLESEHGKLPDTVRVETGSGGCHLIFKCPKERLGTRVGLLLGLDVRAEGGYIVAPPSRHVSGQTYMFEASGSPDDLTPAPLPSWLLGLIRKAGSNGTRPIGVANGVAPLAAIHEGTRNVTLTRMAGAMRASGFGEGAIRAGLLEENAERCCPPLAEAEVERIAASVARYAPSMPRAGGVFWPRHLIRKKEFWSRPSEVRVFQWLLEQAAWVDEETGTGHIAKGQVQTSCEKIAKACAWNENNAVRKWSRSQVRRVLESLRACGLIDVLATEHGTLVTVVNYEQYRGFPAGGGGEL